MNRLRRIVAAAVLAAAMLAAPSGQVRACRISDGQPRPVEASELPTILEPDGAWSKRTDADPERAAFVAAAKQQVVEADSNPKSVGMMWKMQVAWGPATIVPNLYSDPVLNFDGLCSVRPAHLGEVSYWLEDGSGKLLTVVIGDESEAWIEGQFTELFGASQDVTDDMIAAITVEETSILDGSLSNHGSSSQAVSAVQVWIAKVVVSVFARFGELTQIGD